MTAGRLGKGRRRGVTVTPGPAGPNLPTDGTLWRSTTLAELADGAPVTVIPDLHGGPSLTVPGGSTAPIIRFGRPIGPNMLTTDEGCFDAGVGAWTPGSGSLAPRHTAADGTFRLRLGRSSTTGTAEAALISSQTLKKVRVGQVWRASATFASSTPRSCRIQIEIFNTLTNAVTTSLGPAVTSDSSGVTATHTYTVAAGSNYRAIRMRLVVEGVVVGETHDAHALYLGWNMGTAPPLQQAGRRPLHDDRRATRLVQFNGGTSRLTATFASVTERTEIWVVESSAIAAAGAANTVLPIIARPDGTALLRGMAVANAPAAITVEGSGGTQRISDVPVGPLSIVAVLRSSVAGQTRFRINGYEVPASGALTEAALTGILIGGNLTTGTPMAFAEGRMFPRLVNQLELEAIEAAAADEFNIPLYTWGDDFDGAAGTFPDEGRWLIGNRNGYNASEIQYYKRSTNNVKLDGAGNVVFACIKENHTVSGTTWAATSGMIDSRGATNPHRQRYGVWSARVKLPRFQSAWSAFWTIRGFGWPDNGERDGVEALGGPAKNNYMAYTEIAQSTTGFWYWSRNEAPGGTTYGPTRWHVVDMVWEPGRTRTFIDGRLVHETLPNMLTADEEWPFDRAGLDHFAILNLAVGGPYPSDIGEPFPDPAVLSGATYGEMIVDYCRASQVPALAAL